MKYLTLETLSRLALNMDVLDTIRQHEGTIMAALKVGWAGVGCRDGVPGKTSGFVAWWKLSCACAGAC